MGNSVLTPNVSLTKQAAVVDALSKDVVGKLGELITRLPALDAILGALVARVGAANIHWDVLIKVVLGAIAGGPQAVILAILMNLKDILAAPPKHAVPVAQQLVAQAELHGSS